LESLHTSTVDINFTCFGVGFFPDYINIKATLTQTLDGPQLMVFERDLKAAQMVLAAK
jgi:hypothetical protein